MVAPLVAWVPLVLLHEVWRALMRKMHGQSLQLLEMDRARQAGMKRCPNACRVQLNELLDAEAATLSTIMQEEFVLHSHLPTVVMRSHCSGDPAMRVFTTRYGGEVQAWPVHLN
jgi:hypothetical protein